MLFNLYLGVFPTEEEQLSAPSTSSSPEHGDTSATPTERDKVLVSNSQATVFTSYQAQGPDKLPAKVFSFTFSADQNTRPETTFRELEEDSLIHLKTQKEVENIRRTEGMKTFTVITNPNDVHRHDSQSEKTNLNGHAIMPMASFVELNKSKSVRISHQSDKPGKQLPRSTEVFTKPFGTKLAAQNLSSGGEMQKSEDECVVENSKQKIHQVKVEVVGDEDQRKISQRKKEERRRSSLLEWEAMQRQRLEDEEKNRINKNLSMKPVSTKIKELVKMHGSFMSMFSKDKKTDINGTVDGKDDIVFRKISSENLHSIPKNESIKEESPVTMKSPYMVKKLLSPQRHPSPHDASHRTSRRDLSKAHSPNRKSSPTSRKEASKGRPSGDRKEHTSHRILTENNWKNSAMHKETSGSTSHKPRSSSSSSSRSRRTSSKTSSPERAPNNKGKDVLPSSSEILINEIKVSESKPRVKDVGDSSKYSRKLSPPVPPKPSNLHEKSQAYPSPYLDIKRRESSKHENKKKDNSQTSFSHEKRTSEGRSSIKDPKNRKEWLNKMLNSLNCDLPSTLEKTNSPETSTYPLRPSRIHQDRTMYSESTYTEEDPAGKLNGFTSPIPPMRKCTPSSSKIFNEHLHSALMNYSSSSSAPSPKPSSSSSLTVTSVTPLLSSKLVSPHLTKQSADLSDTSYSFKSNPSLPSTPTSLRSSVREALQSDQFQTVNGRRGPVSLSSILGDCSSRSSSMTSTPLTSPRASPERVIKKDSLDLTSKLQVILESSLRDEQRVPLPGEEQKENIAPSPGTRRTESIEKETEEEVSTSTPMSSPRRSSFRLRDRSEERRKGLKMDYAETSPQKKTNSSWQPSPYKPFTFTKPSVTMKTMTSGVDPQRVATFNNSYLHKGDASVTTYLTTCTFPGRHDNKNINCISDQKKSSPENSEIFDSKDTFTSRFSHEKFSLQKRVPELVSMDITESNGIVVDEDREVSSYACEPFSSSYSKEGSSLRSREPSERSTPDRDSGPVSLSSILSRDVRSKDSIAEEPVGFQFKPNLSFSEELNDITRKYCKDMANRRPSSEGTDEDISCDKLPITTSYDNDDVFESDSVMDKDDIRRDSSLEPQSRESSPVQELRGGNDIKPGKVKPAGHKPSKETHSNSPAPKGLPKSTSTSSSKSRNLVVRRNSSLKRNRSQDPGGSMKLKKERKDSEEDPADLKDETVVQDAAGWTKTKTTVRRARLGSLEKVGSGESTVCNIFNYLFNCSFRNETGGRNRDNRTSLLTHAIKTLKK